MSEKGTEDSETTCELMVLRTNPSVPVEVPQPAEDDGDEHKERHKMHGEVIRDIIIGFADGLTVPFALTAGLSSLGSSKIVVLAGLAELFSGSISMGLGAWLAASTQAQHYASEEARERREVMETPAAEEQEVYDILAEYDVSKHAAQPVVRELCARPEAWVKFMMDFELRLEKPAVSRAWISALTMGASYFIGGLVPMIPYFIIRHNVTDALFASIGVTVVILLAFGFLKTWFTVSSAKMAIVGAFQTLFVGVIAAGASYGIVRGVDSAHYL